MATPYPPPAPPPPPRCLLYVLLPPLLTLRPHNEIIRVLECWVHMMACSPKKIPSCPNFFLRGLPFITVVDKSHSLNFDLRYSSLTDLLHQSCSFHFNTSVYHLLQCYISETVCQPLQGSVPGTAGQQTHTALLEGEGGQKDDICSFRCQRREFVAEVARRR